MRDFNFIKNEFIKKHQRIDDINFLEQYITFLTTYKEVQIDTNDYTENHHILPRCTFPEYKNENWNIIQLKYEDHKLVHLWLFKSINVRSYQKPLNWMLNQYRNTDEVSKAAKNGWLKLKNDEDKYKDWIRRRSEYMSSLSKEEQTRRAKIFWDNITEDEYLDFCEKMRNYWTEEKRFKKSKEMKNFYLKNENILKKKLEGKKIWDSRGDEYRENFRKKMDIINKGEEKRKEAGDKIKELWKSKDYLDKMKNRKLRGGIKIKLIDTNGKETTFDTMKNFEEHYKFSAHLIRKYRNTSIEISEDDLNESNMTLKNCKIETING